MTEEHRRLRTMLIVMVVAFVTTLAIIVVLMTNLNTMNTTATACFDAANAAMWTSTGMIETLDDHPDEANRAFDMADTVLHGAGHDSVVHAFDSCDALYWGVPTP